MVFKMGHGGTLDPLATGVLIVGIGRGTKALQSFLGGTKTYETVVLFGKTTNTYDVAGQVVASAPTDQISQNLVEEKLGDFRGNIKQVPPIYSALKINGMKAYDYARTGKPLPRELESRDMVVEECTLLNYYETGTHDFRWPAADASTEEKEAARTILKIEPDTRSGNVEETKKDSPDSAGSGIAQATAPERIYPIDDETGKLSRANIEKMDQWTREQKAAMHTHDIPELAKEPANAPAARVRLTSSSGFYVRSFAHDLGISCGSFGTMAELTRVRQSGYTINDPPPEGQTLCLTYDDLAKGEEVWGPKIAGVLEQWMGKNPVPDRANRVDDRDRHDSRYSKRGGRFSDKPRQLQRAGDRYDQGSSGFKRRRDDGQHRRNSSSPE